MDPGPWTLHLEFQFKSESFQKETEPTHGPKNKPFNTRLDTWSKNLLSPFKPQRFQKSSGLVVRFARVKERWLGTGPSPDLQEYKLLFSANVVGWSKKYIYYIHIYYIYTHIYMYIHTHMNIYIWGAVKIYFNCLVCFWRVIVFWGGPYRFTGFCCFRHHPSGS